MTPSFTRSATQKAALFTAAFAIVGVVIVSRSSESPAFLWPCAVLYILILLNTFYSIRIFASVTPVSDRLQNAIDVILGLLYLWLAWSLGRPEMFAAACVVMFAVATLKYTLLLGHIPHRKLLRHKIQIDAIGTAAAAASLAGILLWDAQMMLWVWAIGFALVQTDIFLLRPLYAFHRE